MINNCHRSSRSPCLSRRILQCMPFVFCYATRKKKLLWAVLHGHFQMSLHNDDQTLITLTLCQPHFCVSVIFILHANTIKYTLSSIFFYSVLFWRLLLICLLYTFVLTDNDRPWVCR